jgi:S-adenosylmethionine:tRNA ribosyltransferase-isomerase
MQRDFNRIDTFDYQLPESLIATKPLEKRTHSRLLHAHVSKKTLTDKYFYDLIDWFELGDVLVLNNTKVIAARFYGEKSSGGRIEGLIERIIEPHKAFAHIKASKSPKPGSILVLEGGYCAKVLRKDEGVFELELTHADPGSVLNWLDYSEQFGHVPLPPYIHRDDQPSDKDRYQCVFHDPAAPGAVAAPTAGLHIDEHFLEAIKKKGVIVTYITLHVGAGTFMPVRTDHLDHHVMHGEWCRVNQETAQVINETKKNKTGRIIAVGTTCVRSLESAVNDTGQVQAFEGQTHLFIRPGYTFKVMDALITNFHLPKSTLLVLVAAFAGYDFIMQAYAHAIENHYRFFSYGDAMLLEV